MTATPPRAKSPRADRVQVDLTPRTALVVMVALALGWLAIELLPIFLVIIVGLMIVGMLAPMIAWLERRRVRRGYAIALVFTGWTALVALVGVLTAPRLFAQLSDIFERLPRLQWQLADLLERNRVSAPLAQSVRKLHLGNLAGEAARIGFAYSSKIVEVIGYGIAAVFFALYLIIDRDRMRGALFALVPREYHVRLSRVLLNLETIVGGYMRGQVITSVLMTVVTLIVLLVARVDNAIALSVFAGLVDILPYIGGLLVCGAAFIATLARGTGAAVLVLVALVAYQEFESRFIVPHVYGKVLRLPSAVVIIALLTGGKLLGILGALLALPIAAGVRMIVEELRFELPGEESADEQLQRRDERAERTYRERAAGTPVEESAKIATEIAEERLRQEGRDSEEVGVVPLTSPPGR